MLPATLLEKVMSYRPVRPPHTDELNWLFYFLNQGLPRRQALRQATYYVCPRKLQRHIDKERWEPEAPSEEVEMDDFEEWGEEWGEECDEY